MRTPRPSSWLTDTTKEEWYTMRWGDLEEPAEKLRWAAEQYRLIKNEMGGADHQAVPLEVEGSPDGLRYDMYVGSVPPLPDHLPLRIGDIYHNLRGALDYLAYQLHKRHHRGNIPSQVVKDSQFPMYNSAPLGKGGTPLPTNSWRAIGTLGAKERIAISWLQPYNARKDKLEGVRAHLRDIGNINNIDKHRNLHITPINGTSSALDGIHPRLRADSGPGIWRNDRGWRTHRYMDIPAATASRDNDPEFHVPSWSYIRSVG